MIKLLLLILFSFYIGFTLKESNPTIIKQPPLIIKHQSIQRKPIRRINIKTRGEEEYRQLGVLYGSDDKVLPLYGRRTYPSSQRWNYYTKSNGYNSFKLPIKRNGQDCTKNLGCKEIDENETINIDNYGNFKTELYELNGPKYIPFVI